MSDLVVQVVKISALDPHPKADRLELATVGGWTVVTGKGNHKVGDMAVHVPPEAMVPRPLADEWGVSDYLRWTPSSPCGRVKAVRLRGYISYGFLAPNDTGAELGEDLADKFGIVKYEQPVKIGQDPGQQSNEHPMFHRYPSMSNLRNYMEAYDFTKETVVTEKIHGSNSRIGFVRNSVDDPFELVIGSHRTQRKVDDTSMYSMPWVKHQKVFEELKVQLVKENPEAKSIIVFGEIYGPGVQDLKYDASSEDKGYRVFDIAIDGEYLPWEELKLVCAGRLPMVPQLITGMFTPEDIIFFSEGGSYIGDNIREGVVIRPTNEEAQWRNGRMIFKVISGDYLARHNGTENH